MQVELDGTHRVTPLVQTPFSEQNGIISPDGQRFLMIKEGGGAEQAATPITLVVVQHFDEELKRLVPR